MANGKKSQKTQAKRGRPRGSGVSLVYNSLRDQILSLERRPGEHLDEQALERAFGVSRTPVREALIRLQADGLVEVSANRGHYVATLNAAELPRIFEALDLLQAAVFRLAAIRHMDKHLAELRAQNEAFWAAAKHNDHTGMSEANRAFHVAVAEAAGNKFLADGYERLLNSTYRIARLMFAVAERHSSNADDYYRRIYDEHAEMIDLIARGEDEALEALSRKHTQLFCDRVAAFVQHRRTLRTKTGDYDFLAPSPGE